MKKGALHTQLLIGLFFWSPALYADLSDSADAANPVPVKIPLKQYIAADRWDAWLVVSNSEADSNRPGDAYEGDIRNTSLGVQWATTHWAIGTTLSHAEAEFDTPGTGDERNERKTSFIPFVAWKPFPGIQLRAFAGVSEGDFSRRRNVINTRFPTTFKGETDTKGSTAGISLLTYAPIGPGQLSTSLTVLRDKTRFDAFTEHTTDTVSYNPIDNPDFTQRVTTVTAQGRYFWNMGKFSPYVTLGWFEHTAGNLDEADPNGWTWGAGLGYRFLDRGRLVVQYSQLEGKQYEENRMLSCQILVTF